jgi:hypothetical protein
MREAMLNGVGALASALIAGVIGFFFGVRRFHYEKVFEHRIEWHQKVVRQLADASQALHVIAVSIKSPEMREDLSELFEKTLAAVPNVELLLEAEMYASRRSYMALKHAWKDWNALTAANVQIVRASQAYGQANAADHVTSRIMSDLAKSVLHAASRLAEDVRSTLRLGSLDSEGRLYNDEQVAALSRQTNIDALDRAKRIAAHKDLP